MLDVYRSPEWHAMVKAMRANPDNAALRLLAADMAQEGGDEAYACDIRYAVEKGNYRWRSRLSKSLVPTLRECMRVDADREFASYKARKSYDKVERPVGKFVGSGVPYLHFRWGMVDRITVTSAQLGLTCTGCGVKRPTDIEKPLACKKCVGTDVRWEVGFKKLLLIQPVCRVNVNNVFPIASTTDSAGRLAVYVGSTSSRIRTIFQPLAHEWYDTYEDGYRAVSDRIIEYVLNR